MTVSTTTTKAIYNGDGSTTAFPTTFEFFDAADIEVIERVIATGAETVKTLSTDYTVSGGNGATGTVNAVTVPASTVQWAIRRKTPLTQEIDYIENDDFPAETHERGLDRGVMIAQERQEELDRALKFPVSDAVGLSPELPNSVDRKSLFLAFDASGDPIASAGPVGEIPVTAFMQTLLDDADAAAARTTLETEGVKASAIASAATTDIWAAVGDFVHVTGTTMITSFGTASRAGIIREVIFDGALTLTHGANLDLPGTANITTAANDRALVRADTTTMAVVMHYQRADGTAVVGGGANGACQLTKSGANLLLSRFDGTTVNIDGALETIPSGGVTLAATSLSVDTNYNIYVFMSGGTMTLEASTTAHATDSTTGMEIKSGDSTRTLVGLARVITGPAWIDTAAQRFVMSWFNRRAISASNTLASANTTSATYVDLTPSNQAEFLTWADEAVQMDVGGAHTVNVASRTGFSQLRLDGSGVGNETQNSTSSGAFWGDVSVGHVAFLSEGKHDISLQGRNSSGADTSTWEDLQLRAITRG